MRHILLSAIAFYILFVGCASEGSDSANADNTADTVAVEKEVALTSIEFDQTEFDFGEVTQGDTVTHTFTFTNTGENDLILSSVKAGCGCTIPSWTKEPVKPGKKGTVEVLFKTSGRKNAQHKTVTVKSNTDPEVTKLKFTAFVLKKEE